MLLLLLPKVLLVSARIAASPNAVHVFAVAADFRLSEIMGRIINLPSGVRRSAVSKASNEMAGRTYSYDSATIKVDAHVGKSVTRLCDPVTAVTTVAVKYLMF
jgi:hypothetical protein